MPASRDRIFEVAKRALETVKSIVPKGEFETPTINAVVLMLFWRAVSLYEGIVLLAKRGYMEEGLILARSLFEDALITHELSVAGDKLAPLVLKWLNKSIAEKEALMKEARRLQLPGDQADVLAEFEQQRTNMRRFAEKHGVQKPKAFLSTRDAALKFGRKDDYWTYRFAHEVTHGSDAAVVFRRRKIESDKYVFHGKTHDHKLIAGLIAFSARSLLQTARASVMLLGWNDEGALDRAELAVAALEL